YATDAAGGTLAPPDSRSTEPAAVDQLAGDPTAVDIAVDPLEGTNLVSRGQDGAISVLAVAERGGLLHAPDIYMEKLCVGPTAAGSGTGDHCVMGSGGAPEGVLTAAALRCLGGQILGQFIPRNAAERERCQAMGIDPDKVYDTHELASGSSLMFCATGVTDGAL